MIDYEDIVSHVIMLRDLPRTTSFERAINRLVKPGVTVLDFGCGTGVLSFFAARAGAKAVFAIDRSAILKVARLLGTANGFENVQFLHGDESSAVLPYPVDLLVSECLGYFAVNETMIEAFLRARDRFLAPGGTICPQQIRFQAHLVRRPNWCAELAFLRTRPYGIDFSAIDDWPFHKAYIKVFGPRDVLPLAFDLGTLDLRHATHQSCRFAGEAVVASEATVYGLAGSFVAVLTETIVLDTGPFAERTHWGQVFFPFKQPFFIRPNRTIQVGIEANRGPTGEVSWRWWIADDENRIDMDDFVQLMWLRSQFH